METKLGQDIWRRLWALAVCGLHVAGEVIHKVRVEEARRGQ